MGQYWRVYNLDKKDVKEYMMSKLGEIFWNGLFDPSMLYRATMPSTRIWSMNDRLDLIKADPTTCPLLRLSPELILLVMEWQDSVTDILALCMAHDILGVVGEPYLYNCAFQIITYFNWAGDRLICVGDYALDDDYPENIQDHVTREVERFVASGDERAQRGRSVFYSCFYKEASHTRPVDSVLLPSREVKHLEKDNANRLHEVQRVIKAMYTPPEGAGLVLCNLSKGECVYEKRLQDLVGDAKSEDFVEIYVDLRHVFALYICWSSDDSCSMSVSRSVRKKLTRGKWAGDRFEVVAENRMRRGVAWKDVTDEAAARLADIWRQDPE